jgi:hypothetical protein
MKFSDNKDRPADAFLVFVKRGEKDMESRDESQALTTEIVKERISFDKGEGKVHLYKILARDVRISENIYDREGNFKAYRSE